MKPSYCLIFQISNENKDLLLGLCYSFGMAGCQEKDHQNGVLIECYFNDETSSNGAEANIFAMFPSLKIEKSVIEYQDWNAKWRESMEPVYIAENIVVSPEWLKPDLKKGDYWIKIEPKMAFGTGHHETTRLAAQALLSVDISGVWSPKLLDIGTGSGILCFVADYSGYSDSIGVEIDLDCCDNLAENRDANTGVGHVSFILGPVESLKANAMFHAIVMNMIRTESEPLLDRCKELLAPGGFLVWSGILCGEKESVVAHAVKRGWDVVKEAKEHEWWCGVLRKRVKS